MATSLKITKLQSELLTDIDMQLMVEKRKRDGICHSVLRYAKARDKYIKDYNQNNDSSYLAWFDKNDLYGSET